MERGYVPLSQQLASRNKFLSLWHADGIFIIFSWLLPETFANQHMHAKAYQVYDKFFFCIVALPFDISLACRRYLKR